MENYSLENANPEPVITQVNKIAAILEQSGGYRFSIGTKGLSSIIYLETGDLTDEEVIKEIILLGNQNDLVSVTLDGSANTITVSPKSLH